jgi:hypothetical protein
MTTRKPILGKSTTDGLKDQAGSDRRRFIQGAGIGTVAAAAGSLFAANSAAQGQVA